MHATSCFACVLFCPFFPPIGRLQNTAQHGFSLSIESRCETVISRSNNFSQNLTEISNIANGMQPFQQYVVWSTWLVKINIVIFGKTIHIYVVYAIFWPVAVVKEYNSPWALSVCGWNVMAQQKRCIHDMSWLVTASSNMSVIAAGQRGLNTVDIFRQQELKLEHKEWL